MSAEESSTHLSPNADATQLLQSICDEELNTSSSAGCDVQFSDILALLSSIASTGSSALHASLQSVLLRVLEVSILRDPRVQMIADRWNMLGPQASEHLSKRIFELTNVKPTKGLVEHIAAIVGGTAVQRGRRVVDYSANLTDLFAEVARACPNRHLRCSICGYHFQRADLGHDRQNLALAEGLVFAQRQRPERYLNRDPWKPIFVEIRRGREIKRKTLTGLTIDHIVPEEGLGWSAADNLAITCKLCNQGKMSYRWALEPLSLFGAGGLADYPKDREFNFLRQAIVVSAYRFHGRKCGKCGITVNEKEITVVPAVKTSALASHSLAPWTLSTTCYDCARPRN